MRYRTGVILILLAGLVWSTQGLILRQISGSGAWTVMLWRSFGLIAAIAAYIAVTQKGQVWRALRGVGRSGTVGACGLVLAFGGAIYALQATTIASAVVLFAAAPFFAAVLGRVFLRTAVPMQTWGAIALAICGIAVMMDGKFAGGNMRGNLAALCSALGFAIFTVSLRAGGEQAKFPVVLLGGLLSVVAGTGLILASGQALIPPAADMGISMFMGCVTLAGGMILYAAAAPVVPSSVAALLSQVEVLLGPFWVWLFLGEGFGRGTAIGGAIVLAALALNAVMTRPAPDANHS